MVSGNAVGIEFIRMSAADQNDSGIHRLQATAATQRPLGDNAALCGVLTCHPWRGERPSDESKRCSFPVWSACWSGSWSRPSSIRTANAAAESIGARPDQSL